MQQASDLAQARAILDEAVVIDTLGGAVVHPTPAVPAGTTYEETMVSQGWNVLHACLVSEPSYSPTWEELQMAVYENLLNFEMNPKARHVECVDDIHAARREGQLGVIFGIQSPTWLDGKRERLRLMYKLGLRSLQLTYMERNLLGDGCLEPENRGLTSFGMQVVRECNRLGILIDCSHVGIQTTLDAARTSSKPIVVSHTAARAIVDNPRCVTDEQMKAVAEKGGTIGITTFSPFIRQDRQPTLDDYLDHYDYVIGLIGEDHVTFATDWFDGNRAGAGGTIGSDFVARSDPDGYTLLVGTSSTLAIAPYIYSKLSYQPLQAFTPVTLLGSADVIVALNADVPIDSVPALIDYAKQNPGKLNYGSGGVGSISHLLGEYFNAMAGVKTLHVPYKGDAQMVTDLVGGQIDLAFGTAVAFLPHIRSGKVKALAVTNAKRSSTLTELPTIAEAGVPGYEAIQWFGVVAPSGTPEPVVERLGGALRKVLAMQDVQERFRGLGFDVVGGTPGDFGRFLQSENAKWKKIAETSGTKLD